MPAQPKSTIGPRVLTVRELAGYLRVHQTTVYRLLREHKLPAFKVGARTGVSTAKRSSGG